MKFSRKVAVLGLIFFLFANELIPAHSANSSKKKKPTARKPTKTKPTKVKHTTTETTPEKTTHGEKEESSTKDKLKETFDEITNIGEEYADQVPEEVGAYVESGFSKVMGVGLKVAEAVSSLAPSPIGNILSFGIGLLSSAHEETKKTEEINAATQSMAKASEGRDKKTMNMISKQGKLIDFIRQRSEKRVEETQSMISSQTNQLYEMEENSKERDELTQQMIIEQTSKLENMEEESENRDLETQEMLEQQMEILTNLNEESAERSREIEELIEERAEKLKILIAIKSEETIDNTVRKLERNELLRDIRRDMNILNTHYNKYLDCIFHPCANKNDTLAELTEDSRGYRKRLDLFVTKYFVQGDFYELYQEDEEEKIDRYIDCNSQSFQTKLLNSYIKIITMLTNCYSIIGPACSLKHRDIRGNNTNQSGAPAERSFQMAFDKFMGQLQTLMIKTKNTLIHTSAEIRKCGPNIQSEEYGGLDFLKIALIGYRNSLMLRRDHVDIYPSVMWEYMAEKDSIPWNYFDYSKFNCKDSHLKNFEYYFDPDIPVPGYHHIYDNEKSETYGNKDDVEDLESYNFTGDMKQCYVYSKTKKAGFSTQSVEAQPGHVVTGIRWRITDNIVYMDIREAKFINGLQVDRSTEEWYETPTSDEFIEPFTEHHRGILLADVQLGTGFFVTGVKMIFINGKLTLSVRGSGTNEPGTKLFGLQSYVRPKSTKSSEWKINEADNPDSDQSSVPSRKSVDSGYYVNLQPTDFKKDLGRRTIPYFDFQNVITDPSAPIGGLGIYYKVFEGYGGFVALTMLSPDYAYMINEKKLKIYEQTFQWNNTLAGQSNGTKNGKLKNTKNEQLNKKKTG